MEIFTKTKIAALVFGLSLSQGVSALLLKDTGTDVGDIDELIASTYLSDSGSSSQINWVATVLDFNPEDLTVEKIEDMDEKASDWRAVKDESGSDVSDVKAFELSEPVYYYLLKLGNIMPGKKDESTTPPPPDHFLFDNAKSLQWAVIDFGQWFEDYNVTFDLEKISHISQFESPTNEVSEPGTIGLLGLGLVALGAIRRRMRGS